MKDISDFGWLCILLIFVSISASCWGIFGSATTPEDPLAKQIREIGKTYPFDSKEKSKLISEIISRYQLITNATIKVENNTK